MNVSVRVLNKDPLKDVRQAMLTTLGKEFYPMSFTTYADELNYWVKLFVQKHSIIRPVTIRVDMENCRADVARQLLRATKGHPQPYMESGRPDWTKKVRSVDPLHSVRFMMDFTPEAFMAMANQRLCRRAMKETRQVMVDIVKTMGLSEDPLLEALSLCCVPNCVFQCGCPEGKFNCGYFKKNLERFLLPSLTERYYNHYEELFKLEDQF